MKTLDGDAAGTKSRIEVAKQKAESGFIGLMQLVKAKYQTNYHFALTPFFLTLSYL